MVQCHVPVRYSHTVTLRYYSKEILFLNYGFEKSCNPMLPSQPNTPPTQIKWAQEDTPPTQIKCAQEDTPPTQIKWAQEDTPPTQIKWAEVDENAPPNSPSESSFKGGVRDAEDTSVG